MHVVVSALLVVLCMAPHRRQRGRVYFGAEAIEHGARNGGFDGKPAGWVRWRQIWATLEVCVRSGRWGIIPLRQISMQCIEPNWSRAF